MICEQNYRGQLSSTRIQAGYLWKGSVYFLGGELLILKWIEIKRKREFINRQMAEYEKVQVAYFYICKNSGSNL